MRPSGKTPTAEQLWENESDKGNPEYENHTTFRENTNSRAGFEKVKGKFDNHFYFPK